MTSRSRDAFAPGVCEFLPFLPCRALGAPRSLAFGINRRGGGRSDECQSGSPNKGAQPSARRGGSGSRSAPDSWAGIGLFGIILLQSLLAFRPVETSLRCSRAKTAGSGPRPLIPRLPSGRWETGRSAGRRLYGPPGSMGTLLHAGGRHTPAPQIGRHRLAPLRRARTRASSHGSGKRE